jgi:hypothetical protein
MVFEWEIDNIFRKIPQLSTPLFIGPKTIPSANFQLENDFMATISFHNYTSQIKSSKDEAQLRIGVELQGIKQSRKTKTFRVLCECFCSDGSTFNFDETLLANSDLKNRYCSWSMKLLPKLTSCFSAKIRLVFLSDVNLTTMIEEGLTGLIAQAIQKSEKIPEDKAIDEKVELQDLAGYRVSFSFEELTRTSSVMKTMLLKANMVESKTRIIQVEKFSRSTLHLFSVMVSRDSEKIMEQLKDCNLEDAMELLEFIHLYDFAIWKPVVEELICDKMKNEKAQISLVRLFTFADLYNLDSVLLLCLKLRTR